MDFNTILILLMLFALLLSLISCIMVSVCILKTNTKMKSFFKSFKFSYLNNFIDKGLKKNENQYSDPEVLYSDYVSKRAIKTAERFNIRN